MPRVYLSVPHMGHREAQYVREAFETNWLSSVGPNLDAFERAFAERVGRPAVALASGGARLEIRRADDGVAWRRLDAAAFAFRTALADGLVLAAAMASATLQDPAFDVTAAVQHLLAEGLVVAYCLSSER